MSIYPPSKAHHGESTEFVLAREDAFDFMHSEFAELFEASKSTAFQHPGWLDAFYRHLPPHRDAEKLIVTGRDSITGRLAFLLPLIKRSIKGVGLVESSDLGVSDYVAPIIRSDAVLQLQADASLPKRIPTIIGSYDLLRIKPIREELISHWQLLFAAEPQLLDFSAHETVMEQPYAQWRLEALGKSFAKNIDYKSRRLEKVADVRMEIVTPDEAEEAICFIQEQRKGRFDGDLIQQQFVREFYTEIAKNSSAGGISRTYQLLANGERAGVVFGLTHNHHYYYLLIGCDYPTFGKYSPGLLLYDRIMADWLEQGGKVFDFTIGDEPFKAKFAAKPTAMHQIFEAGSLLGRLVKAGNSIKGHLNGL